MANLEILSDLRLRQSTHRKLRRVVDRETLKTYESGDRRNIDNRARSRFFQRGESRFDALEHPREIDRNGSIPQFNGGVFESHEFGDSGIVHQHVQPTESLYRSSDGAIPIFCFGDIEVHIKRIFTQLCSERRTLGVRDVTQDDLGALGDKQPGVGCPHALGSTADKDDFS